MCTIADCLPANIVGLIADPIDIESGQRRAMVVLNTGAGLAVVSTSAPTLGALVLGRMRTAAMSRVSGALRYARLRSDEFIALRCARSDWDLLAAAQQFPAI